MVWGGGLMSAGGAVSSIFGQVIDFAGGTVVEIASGTAALVLVLILGNRHGFGKDPGHRPHNIPFIMLGAGILWFGWFGFNAGAATTVEQAGLIWVNTLAAPAAAMHQLAGHRRRSATATPPPWVPRPAPSPASWRSRRRAPTSALSPPSAWAWWPAPPALCSWT